MSNPPVRKDKPQIKCLHCGYDIKSPYPADLRCPKCNKYIIPRGSYSRENSTPIDFNAEWIGLKREKEYIKFCGITTVERTALFASNKRFLYLLELTNNLDFIATSFLGGNLYTMVFKSENGETDKCQFFKQNNIIYILFGRFPDKTGKFFLEQIATYFSNLFGGKDVNKLKKIDKYNFEQNIKSYLLFIFKEYPQFRKVFYDHEISSMEDWLRLYYVGISSISIGTISVLLDDNEKLNVKVPGEFENQADELEMKEAVLTAKIDAIVANILGNTGAYPRCIAVKLGFQNFRFLTFKNINSGFISCISQGNIKKLGKMEIKLELLLESVIGNQFTGTSEDVRKIKEEIRTFLKEKNPFS